MKKNTNMLDDFLHDKVEEANFPYKEEYWEKMSAVLDERDKKKKGPFFWLWRGLSTLAIIVIIGVGTFLMKKPHNAEEANVTASKQPVESQESKFVDKEIMPSVKKDLPSNNTAENLTKNDEKKQADEKNEVNKPSVKHANETSEQNENDTKRNVQPEGKSQNSKSTVKETKSSTSTSTKAQQKENDENKVKENTSVATSDTKSAKPKGFLKQLLTKSSKSKPSKSENKTSGSTDSKVTKSTKAESNNTVASNSKSSNQTTTIPSTAETIIHGQKVQAIDTNHYTVKAHRDETIYNPRYIGSLSDYIPERYDSVTEITYQKVESKKETASTHVDSTKKASTKSPFGKHPLEYIILAGLNMNKGFTGNVAGSTSWGYSPYIGAGIEKQISNSLSLSSHVGFTYFNGLNTQVSVPSYQYSFGLDSSSISVAHKKLLQLYLPMSVYYEVMKNHYLLAALGMYYSMDVSSKVTETTMSNNIGHPGTNSKAATSSSSTQNGYRTGFNQFDLFVQLGYSYKILNKVMLQCSIQQGFFDMTKNAYFNNSISNTQTRISVGLKYNFKRN